MSPVFHLVVESELLAGLGASHYTPARFAEDGFVHCCGTRESTLAVARDYFGGAREPVYLLELEPKKLDAKLVFEAPAPLPGAATEHLATAETFPHVYGPLALRAVSGAARLESRGGGFVWPERFETLGESLAAGLAARLRAGEARGLEALRKLRRSHSRGLKKASGKLVLELGGALVAGGAPGARVLASELVLHHPTALDEIGVRDVKRLAGELASWGDVDVFACMIAGQAFRDGQLSEREILRWTRSRDRWWRRAALVATVPLNVRAQGGKGDSRRTLRICRELLADSDDMVVKALSWALRALSERDPGAVRRFVETHQNQLALRALRELRNKLRTGRKSG